VFYGFINMSALNFMRMRVALLSVGMISEYYYSLLLLLL